ncbi:MAG: hypothetical protein ACRD36_10650, partial [Candidatus Acidiferrum sp.]
YGEMRLVLQKFGNTWLIHSEALVNQGGRSFLFIVRDGKAVRVPAVVQVSDGKVAKVEIMEQLGDEEIARELTGSEDIIASNQGELADGQPVSTSRMEW